MSGRHAPHLRLAVPPRLSAHPSFRFPSTPLPTPSKSRGLPYSSSAASPSSSPYAAALLRLLVLHALFLLAPSVRALPSLAHALALSSPLTLLSAAALLLLHFAASARKTHHQPHHPFPGIPALLRPALLLALSILLRLVALRFLPSPGLLVLADSAGSLLARALRRPSRRRVLSVAVAALSLACISPSASVILAIPFASGFLSSAEQSAAARHATRTRRARAAAFALAAAFLSVPALVGLSFFGGSDAGDAPDAAVPFGPLWWLLLNSAFFGMALGRRQEHGSGGGRPSVDFAMTFLCTLVLELLYYPKLSLPGFLICGFLLWTASRELAPAGYVQLGTEDASESVFEAVMGPARHILSERKSRKIAAFLLINTAYMFVEFGSGFMSDSLGLISDACHMLFDCAALAIGLYASYIARLPANGMYNFGRGRFEVLSGYVNAVFLVLVGALIVLESFERILEPREISTSSLLAVSIGGLVVNIIGLVFFHEEHHHAHGGTCSHSHSHSHSHHGHGHHQHHDSEDHKHHDHDHHGANNVKACCDHHGDDSHRHDHHGNSNSEGIHNNIMDNTCKEKHSHSHGHEHHHHEHSDHCHESRDHAHQNCNSISIEQQLLDIPLSNISSHDTEGHSSKAGLRPSDSGNSNKSGHRHHIDHNMEGIFLHVLADTMGSVGVVISTLLIKYKGWLIADPICSVFISVMIVSSVLPLLRNSAEILLQRVPRSHEKDLAVALDDVMKIDGVLGVNNVHVWNLTNTDIVGTFHLHVSAEADKSSIRNKASRIFQEAGVQDLTIEIECVKR
ncbi:unnamed protein product [Miscanthus lutarioriparius]|uniref:Cation efflux protein transmembrane domain-containing protein n=1 Tax=Miscanthus lutarioriparius TaxID=422564 RepID=A0A811PPW3_9POAL|nr:unnamed protein product [Miscanthus lutarioriparius]